MVNADTRSFQTFLVFNIVMLDLTSAVSSQDKEAVSILLKKTKKPQ